MEPSAGADEGKAALYGALEASLLRELQKRLDSGEATASELATAAALLGKAGTPARSAGAGIKGSDESAMLAWLSGLPPAEKDRMLAEAVRQQAGGALVPSGRRGGPKGVQADAGELGNAA